MKIMVLLFIVLSMIILSLSNAQAADFHFRADGGSIIQCDGTVNSALNRNGHCSWVSNTMKMKVIKGKTDHVYLDDGEFELTVKPATRKRYGK